MSLNVLVIPEDFRKDQYVLAPLTRKICAEAGTPRARVEVCTDPLLGGIAEALNWDRIVEVIDMYPMVQVFLLLVDRDGVEGRRVALRRIEALAADKLGSGRVLLGENAWQEIEVWALAGQELPKKWKWQEIRAEKHPKETYFEPWAKKRQLTKEPGEGRTTMGREAATNYDRVRSRCKKDIHHLEKRLRDWFGEN
jgi:hypothetical protein